MDEQQYQKAKNYLERLLAQHQRTIFEVRTKLRQKKFASEIINQVVKEFIELDLLDDEKYIHAWLENQIAYRPCGKILCLKKLLTKGLNYEQVKNILDEVLTEEKEIELAENLASRRLAFYRDWSLQKKSGKIVSFLKSRGFGDGVIINVIERFKLNTDF